MFKIVQTTERGINQLSIIPANWEKGGSLFWPKTGADKLIKNPSSIPDQANCFVMNCKLKRNQLINFEVAEEELNRMIVNEDTEEDDQTFHPKKKKQPKLRKVNKPNNSKIEQNFNDLANECIVYSNKDLQENVASTSNSNFNNNNNSKNYIVESQGEVLSTINENDDCTLNNSLLFASAIKDEELHQKVDLLLEKQEDILQQLGNIPKIEDFNKMLQHIAKLEITMETLISSKSECSCKKNKDSLEISDEIFFQPIDNLEELEEFEKKISEKNNMAIYIKKFSYVCGTKGGNSTNNCYMLVDKIFTRRFLTLASWAGGARDSSKEKIPFKIFKNTISFFLQIIKLSDEDFSLKQCEDFFKAVIRNSKKRYESGLCRASKTKQRPSNLTYKPKSANSENANENGDESSDEETE